MLILVALALGILLGMLFQPGIPPGVAIYLPMAVMVALDSIFGGLRARLDGTFDDRVFLVAFASNAALAGLLVWAGERLGVADLSIAVVVVFGVRIFRNLSAIRSQMLNV